MKSFTRYVIGFLTIVLLENTAFALDWPRLFFSTSSSGGQEEGDSGETSDAPPPTGSSSNISTGLPGASTGPTMSSQDNPILDRSIPQPTLTVPAVDPNRAPTSSSPRSVSCEDPNRAIPVHCTGPFMVESPYADGAREPTRPFPLTCEAVDGSNSVRFTTVPSGEKLEVYSIAAVADYGFSHSQGVGLEYRLSFGNGDRSFISYNTHVDDTDGDPSNNQAGNGANIKYNPFYRSSFVPFFVLTEGQRMDARLYVVADRYMSRYIPDSSPMEMSDKIYSIDLWGKLVVRADR